MHKFLSDLSDLKDLVAIIFGFVAFVTPMILVYVEGARCAGWLK